MKFKDWLNDFSVIKEKCQPFFDVTHLPMYRGAAVPLSLFSSVRIEKVRKDRRPRDSSAFTHKLIDDWFFENMGMRPRSQGAFCTGKPQIADTYGKVHYAFPIGDFDYLWGRWKVDFVESPSKRRPVSKGEPVVDTLALSNALKETMQLRRDDEAKEVTDSFMKLIEWNKNTGIDYALTNGGEVVIICDEIALVEKSKIKDYSEFLKKVVR